MPRLRREELPAWRARLGITQKEAELRVFGEHQEGRVWRQWENGTRAVPKWLTYIYFWAPDMSPIRLTEAMSKVLEEDEPEKPHRRTGRRAKRVRRKASKP